MKNKWYEESVVDESPIVSSRVRLARNIKKYPFSLKLTDEAAENMIKDVASFIENKEEFVFTNLFDKTSSYKRVLVEQHVISPALANKISRSGIIRNEEDTIDVMINEEDHIRIQSIEPGDNIEKAFERADKIDDLIEEKIEYAFDSDFGYLTSCPSNTGTGLRASFMLHLPFLERTGQLRNIVGTLGKFGMTVRGIYGEGSESLGSIYQVSNQLTLGKNESEIIEGLKTITYQVSEKEKWLLEASMSTDEKDLEDMIYRSYGVLKNCRKISVKESVALLSNIRLGYISGILKEKKPEKTIYYIMMNMQEAFLNEECRDKISPIEKEVLRAEYIRGLF